MARIALGPRRVPHHPGDARAAPATDDDPKDHRVPAALVVLVVGAILVAAVAAAANVAPRAQPTGAEIRLTAEDQSDVSVVGTADLPPVGTITGERALEGAGPRVGALAPDLTWTAPDGSPGSLAALRGGPPVIVNFWATWCVPCRTEMPTLERVAASEPGLTVLEIDLQEDAVSVGAFFKRYGLTKLVPLIDADGRAFRRYGVANIPTTFFVDRDGIIRDVELGGPMTEERLRAGIAKARQP